MAVTRAAAFAALLLAAPTVGAALSMEVAPLLIEIGRDAPSAIVTVRNAGSDVMRCQVSAMAWSESLQGEPQLTPSQELSFFPPLFQLKPGEERKIRVGATVAPAGVERAWRLFVEEVPSAVESGGGRTTVQFRTRFAIPVFQLPLQPAPRAALKIERLDGKLKLLVQNDGNVHFRPEIFAVTMRDATGKSVFDAEIPTWTVLAGRSAARDIPLPPGVHCAAVRGVSVVAASRDGPVQATMALPDGACGP